MNRSPVPAPTEAPSRRWLDEHAAAVLRSASHAVVCCSTTGVLTALNPSAEALYAQSAEDAVGRPLTDLFTYADGTVDTALFERVREGQSVTYETVHERADGRRIEVVNALSQILDEDGACIGLSIVVRDVGRRLAVERELAETRRLLEVHAADLTRSNGDLEEFAYVASHDLSEPLRTITGMLALLQEECGGRLGEDADDYIARAVAGAERMRNLIDDLLSYSRIGRRRAAHDQVDLAEVVADAVRALGDAITTSSAEVAVTGPLPVVEGDAVALGQVLQNLLSNALKFNDSARPHVEISAERESDAWRVSVTDDGIGVQPEHAERVFGVFKRLHTRDAYAGTGIGLAVCQRVVERRGGHIWVEPVDGSGTRVSFTLPDRFGSEAG